jgi:lysophospholipase L1-like esterase
MRQLTSPLLLCAWLACASACSDADDAADDEHEAGAVPENEDASVDDSEDAGGRDETDGGPAHDASADAASNGPARDASVDAASNGPPAVRYVGRVDLSDAKGGKFSWSGTGVIARFSGSALSVSLTGGQEYTVLIDGALRPKLAPKSGLNLIANDLSAGTHTVELYRRTEANQGVSQFLGFTFAADGALLAPPAAALRRIEIIGDSITCGYGNEGADQTCKFTPQTENHYLTYGAIAARNLNAELSTIAWSGLGMVCNYGDDANSCMNPLPTYYERTLPTDANSRWDFSQEQPDAVVINLGTNDFSTSQDPTEKQFTDAYKAFLLRVRGKYPRARILCTIGPLLPMADLTNVRRYIANAVADSGDDNMTTFDLEVQSAMDGLGCDYHPSLKTHQKMADALTKALKLELGW